MSKFNLFAYGTLKDPARAREVMPGSELVGNGSVHGILYDIDGDFTAVILYGTTPIPGVVWRCPAEVLPTLDRYEDIDGGLFRRVGHEVMMDDGTVVPCWIYVAGPGLRRKLVPEARIGG